MSDFDDLERRLADYGDVLRGELAGWPAFVPSGASGTPLQLLRRRLGRWLGAGHRPLLFFIVAVAALAVVLFGTFRTSGDDGPVAAVSPASVLPSSAEADGGAEATDRAGEQDIEPAAPEVIEVEPQAQAPAADDGSDEDEVAADPAGSDDIVASVPEPECSEGERMGRSCRITGARIASLVDAACVAQGGVGDGSTGCFRSAGATQVCSAGEFVEESCVEDLGSVVATATCPDGSAPRDGLCQVERPVQAACVDGREIDGRCLAEVGPAAGGEPACPIGTLPGGDACISTVAGSCPDGAVSAGGCVVAASIVERATCPSGLVLAGNRCEPPSGCPDKSKSIDAQQDKQVSTSDCGSAAMIERTCSATGLPASAGECVTVVAPICPSGTSSSAGGCVSTHAMVVTPFSCPADQLRIGGSCFVEAVPVDRCERGVLTGSVCVAETEAIVGAPSCPQGGVVSGARCLRVSDPQLRCEVGDLVFGACVVEIAIDRAELCGADEVVEGDHCVRYVESS